MGAYRVKCRVVEVCEQYVMDSGVDGGPWEGELSQARELAALLGAREFSDEASGESARAVRFTRTYHVEEVKRGRGH